MRNRTLDLRGILFFLIVLGNPRFDLLGQDLLRPLGTRSWIAEAANEASSNGAVFAGSDAALVVDPGMTSEEALRLIAQAARVSGVPVRYVVLTHWHPDHARGVLCLPKAGLTLVSTGATRRRLAEGSAQPGLDGECTPHLPELLVDGSRVLDLGGHIVHLLATGHGHTAGDLSVWSPQDRTLATGDLYNNQSSPFMEEGVIGGWLGALDRLLSLRPEHVIPGHFEESPREGLQEFRRYLEMLRDQAVGQIAEGIPISSLSLAGRAPEFAHYRQFPQYRATFDDNLRAVARQLVRSRLTDPGEAGYTRAAELEVGRNPHQISFSNDLTRAFIAAAGSDQIAVVATAVLRPESSVPVTGTPLGVMPRNDRELIVTRFRGRDTVAVDSRSGQVLKVVETGPGSSLIVPVGDSKTVMVSSEGDNRLLLIDATTLEVQQSYPTGRRPFPAATTSDGRLAFVPNYDDASVTVIDLWNQKVSATVAVGAQPSGGVVLPGDHEYAVAIRGEDRLAFINTASFEVTGQLVAGIGDSPFSVVVSGDSTRAFVNNTASHDISVVDLAQKRVITRIPTGEIPIVMAFQLDQPRLWVSSEGSHTLSVYAVPPVATPPAVSEKATEVGVLGMIHGGHRTSRSWGLEQVRDTIRKFKPDVLCIEIPPNRWERIWYDYAERGQMIDSRVVVFPEYTDVVLPLRAELGFQIEPCAAWTTEMNDLRNTRLRQFQSEDRFRTRNEEYTRLRQEVRGDRNSSASEDPLFIHSDEYDHAVRREYEVYDRYLNDWIGPGGWTNINQAHSALIHEVLEKHRGKRILITFGAAHKYWILDQLRSRSDVTIKDMREFLPGRRQN